MSIGLIKHMETEMGTIQHGWKKFPDGENWPFQVVEMTHGKYKGVSAFSTLGLSNYPLLSPSNKSIFQEVFLLFPTSYGYENIPAVLYETGNFAINKQKAYLQGDVIDHHSGTIFPGIGFTSFYITYAACYSEKFDVYYHEETNRHIVMCWLIPIYDEERLFIYNNGWDEFDKKIENKNPNFIDIHRKPIV